MKTITQTSFFWLPAFFLLTFLLRPVSSKGQKTYLRWVGDSEFNIETDDSKFSPCGSEDRVLQYFNTGEGPQYVGEKPALLKHFYSKFQPPENNHQSGMIRIRFLVNCEGKAGRFRLTESDETYSPFTFDPKITGQLMQLTREIKDWKILKSSDTDATDYYFYLIFKIKDGRIINILP